MLSDKLKSFVYYERKLPLYLQNSYGFLEHFRIFYDLLTSDSNSSVVPTIDLLFELLNIFDRNCTESHQESYERNLHYLNFVNSLPDANDGNSSDVLDKIGNLFGLKRQLSVSINGTEHMLNLNNKDFLMLIKCTIIKNYFDGSYSELNHYYQEVCLPVFTLTSAPARCDMYLISVKDPLYKYSSNVEKMFLSGLLTVESMGIMYTYAITGAQAIAEFDFSGEGFTHNFDYGVFVI